MNNLTQKTGSRGQERLYPVPQHYPDTVPSQQPAGVSHSDVQKPPQRGKSTFRFILVDEPPLFDQWEPAKPDVTANARTVRGKYSKPLRIEDAEDLGCVLDLDETVPEKRPNHFSPEENESLHIALLEASLSGLQVAIEHWHKDVINEILTWIYDDHIRPFSFRVCCAIEHMDYRVIRDGIEEGFKTKGIPFIVDAA
ncbi:hypothetical protein [Acidithiobacillus ferridurans]|uniref:Uncharacterized protein n=1 Tax=Acidithiobacillus ferridurans TaxID=1232575 RepID=A0A8X8KBW1_ACIFI|nr:hypothetical protein [Acidithiobacillus ferridurans]MBU2715606.1 hypothetical protein [Acidithiobacillus ferridurans]MBU2722904.1 hypothetical protein [Acidithiobacillus ferridurans]MBU2728204.1 hypothetical protein [Acidithiobacillus ferridurans]